MKVLMINLLTVISYGSFTVATYFYPDLQIWERYGLIGAIGLIYIFLVRKLVK